MHAPFDAARFVSRRAAAGLALAVAATGLAALPGGSATAAGDQACPEAYPVEELTEDQRVTGLTVSRGVTPEPFTGEVLGVIDDGIAPDLDMIMVRLSSEAIDAVGGIWAGMSGSPVYARDGRLIGAVSYGLALGPSPVAGVTPAEAMLPLVTVSASSGANPGARAASGADEVAIPESSARTMQREGDASSDQTGSGFVRLPLPLGISGISTDQRMRKLVRRLGVTAVLPRSAGAVSPGAATTDVVAGGNLASSLSYGDLSAVGVGTATAVCGDRVVGFGHPMLWSGRTTMTMHGAKAVYVQEDPTLFPFKVANPTGPVGTIDQDRLAGITGILGAPPRTSEATASVSVTGGASRTGSTFISLPDAVPELAAFHLLVDQDRVFDAIGPGSSLVSWTVQGTRAGGSPWGYTRTNRYASDWDISFDPVWEILSQLWQLQENPFRAVTIDEVQMTSAMDPQVRRFRIGRLEQLRGGEWVTLTRRQPALVRPGRVLRLRVTLRSFRDELGTRTVRLRLQVPDTVRRGSEGSLNVRGGSGDEFFFDEEGGGGGGTQPKNLDELISSLAGAPRNDTLVAELVLSQRRGAMRVTADRQLSDVVRGHRTRPVLVW